MSLTVLSASILLDGTRCISQSKFSTQDTSSHIAYETWAHRRYFTQSLLRSPFRLASVWTFFSTGDFRAWYIGESECDARSPSRFGRRSIKAPILSLATHTDSLCVWDTFRMPNGGSVRRRRPPRLVFASSSSAPNFARCP